MPTPLFSNINCILRSSDNFLLGINPAPTITAGIIHSITLIPLSACTLRIWLFTPWTSWYIRLGISVNFHSLSPSLFWSLNSSIGVLFIEYFHVRCSLLSTLYNPSLLRGTDILRISLSFAPLSKGSIAHSIQNMNIVRINWSSQNIAPYEISLIASNIISSLIRKPLLCRNPIVISEAPVMLTSSIWPSPCSLYTSLYVWIAWKDTNFYYFVYKFVSYCVIIRIQA